MKFSSPATPANRRPVRYSVPTEGGTTTFLATDGHVVGHNAGLLAAHTLQLPNTTVGFDGQVVGFTSHGGITALTVTNGAGWANLSGAPTTLAAGGTVSFICSGSYSGWTRI